MKPKHVFIILIVILVYNCSTPYQPKGALGGHSSNQLGENNYKVSFKGNQHTTAETVFDYLLRRCAEIAIEENGKYFIIYEDSSYVDKIVFENELGIDDYLDYIEYRKDKHALKEKTGMDYDPLQTLADTKSRIKRTYSSNVSGDGSCNANSLIDLEAKDVTGVYKIQIFDEQIEGYEDYFFSASEILEKYDEE